ncbi:hypothetical protein GYMLUDRAFT_64752 [Collybiopsis luxurians FD-317 M1]|uniref:Uncharacterized protein n=1 Tax=Collybiopsis luxurians FD-317 M1 TaxID=944289 RepID=A0A0D0AMZ1_9AGAR|nr:hypothetical protein GYMLUDRAFT_64752 [Collybiopsis luxurians FD-317 M1]
MLALSGSSSSHRRTYSHFSPSESHLPGFLFNSKIVPSDLDLVPGHMFSLYFGLKFAQPQLTFFSSNNTSPFAVAHKRHKHWINFHECFAWDFQGNNMYTTLVIVKDRQYIIAGTYDPALKETNLSLASVRCSETFRGDIGICLFSKWDPECFMQKAPPLRQLHLGHALNVYVKNVKNHVEKKHLRHIIQG